MSIAEKEASILEWDDSTNNTVKYTPPGSVIDDLDVFEVYKNKPPLPGHTYRIHSIECGRQLTLVKGEVVLAKADSLGSPYWVCEKHNHLYGFRNLASNKYLGHNGKEPGKMRCAADHYMLWEQLQVVAHEPSDGGFSLLTEYWRTLKSVGEGPQSKKGHVHRVLKENDPGMAWLFIEAL